MGGSIQTRGAWEQYGKKYRANNIAAGICDKCSEPALPDKLYCARHREESTRRNAKRHAKSKADGLCLACHKVPVTKKLICESCKFKRWKYSVECAGQRVGISFAEYTAMFAKQNGRCAICMTPPSEKRRLAIDHDHKTGHVRGLLCSRCNTGIGLLRDDQAALERAIAYLGKS